MTFTSIKFAIYFIAVFVLYWLVLAKRTKWQNVLLLFASFLFYCSWDWRYSGLLIAISLCTWGVGLLLDRYRSINNTNKLIATANILVCLLSLGAFKYYNFFYDSFCSLFNIANKGHSTLRLLLPVGISFYSFKAISYTVDVYRGTIKACKSPIPVLTYISFFPQLLAGPIERAKSFIPQLESRRDFSYEQGADSMRQILWGLFKKVVIADQCAIYVNEIYSVYNVQSGSTLIIAAILYSFQIYADFSGYSDISIGLAGLLGFNIGPNFKSPYFSRNIAEFWRRWHISLTSWFREYVYFPLGGSRCCMLSVIRNTAIVFLLSGLWHGANWTFLAWGGIYAILYIPLIISGANKKFKDVVSNDKRFPDVKEFVQMFVTFMIVTIAWIFFRADNIGMAVNYIGGMLQFGTLKACYRIFIQPEIRHIIIMLFLMIAVEWLGRKELSPIYFLKGKNHCISYSIYAVISFLIFWFWNDGNVFVYQQF